MYKKRIELSEFITTGMIKCIEKKKLYMINLLAKSEDKKIINEKLTGAFFNKTYRLNDEVKSLNYLKGT